MRSLRALGYSFERALDGLHRHPVTAAAVTGTVAVAFFLVGLVFAVSRVALAATASWQPVHMVVYLDDGLTPDRANDIRSAIAEWPAVRSAEYVTPEQAMARFLADSDAPDVIVDGVESSMLPASIEVVLADGVQEIAALPPIVERMRAADGIEHIEFADVQVSQLTHTRQALDRASGIALLLACLGCLLLATTALAGRFAPRLRDAAVARLCGASSMFVRAPLLIEGGVQGALGAGLAAFGVWWSIDAIRPSLGALLDAEGADASLPLGIGGLEVAGFIAIGAVLGMTSTWLATRRHAY